MRVKTKAGAKAEAHRISIEVGHDIAGSIIACVMYAVPTVQFTAATGNHGENNLKRSRCKWRRGTSNEELWTVQRTQKDECPNSVRIWALVICTVAARSDISRVCL